MNTLNYNLIYLKVQCVSCHLSNSPYENNIKNIQLVVNFGKSSIIDSDVAYLTHNAFSLLLLLSICFNRQSESL